MKKLLTFILCLLLTLSLAFAITGCNDSDVSYDEVEYSDDDFEDESTQEIKVEVLDKYTYSAENEDMTMPDGVTIPSLDDDYVLLDIEITNLTDKNIESVSGTLNIKNGDYKVKLICDFDQETIPADDSVVYEGYNFKINEYGFNMAEKVVFDCDYDELDFEFVVDEIKYE